MINFRLSVRIYQPSNLPEFCLHRCWALSQDPLVSEYPGTSRFQKSPPTDSVVRLWMLFDDAFVAICPLYEKKRLLVSIVGYMLINWLTADKGSSFLNFYNLPTTLYDLRLNGTNRPIDVNGKQFDMDNREVFNTLYVLVFIDILPKIVAEIFLPNMIPL